MATARARFVYGPLGLVVVLIGVAVALLGWGVVPADLLPDGTGLFFEIVAGLGYTTVGTVILGHRPGHRIGRAMLVVGLVTGGGAGAAVIVGTVDQLVLDLGSIAALSAAVHRLIAVPIVLGNPLILVWFPQGRRTSRLGGVTELLGVAVVLRFAVGLVPGWALPPELDLIPIVVILAMYGVALVDLATRYRGSSGLDQAQIRWVLASAALTASLGLAVVLFGDETEVFWIPWLFSLILPVIAVGIAILRYRLYEIDRIISRTIGYALVTGILGLTLAVLVVVLGGLLARVAEGETIAVAASTLAAFALLQPVRRRVQKAVDRRFDRATFDAERTVTGFAGRLRVDHDLESVRAEIVDTTSASVRPTTAAVWIRSTTP